MERATQDGYITHRSIHWRLIMHQPSWSYASSIIQPSCRWSYQHGKSYTRWLHHTPIKTRKDYHASTSWPYASSITQPSWRWSYKHGKSYTKWLHHTPINTRKDYHESTFMTICIKHNSTILALELSTCKELHKMVTSHTDQYTKRLSCINFMTIRIKHNPTILALELSTWKELHKMVTSHTDQYTEGLSCIKHHDHTPQA